MADAPDLGSGVRKDVPVRLRSAPLVFAWALFLTANAAIINSQSHDPFSFLSPAIQISAADRARIERGDTIVNILPARAHEVAMIAITPASMSPERLVQWVSDVERLKAEPVKVVHRVKRLSAEPALQEFSTLDLPD